MQWDTQMVAESLSLKSALWRVSGRLETALKQEGRAIYDSTFCIESFPMIVLSGVFCPYS